jgi:hypothetical protein
MTFSINFVRRAHEPTLALGQITIGAFVEHFQIDLSFWNPMEYERQWRAGIQRLIDGAPSSCLLQSISKPQSANFFFWWRLYRLEGAAVAAQNAILIAGDLPEIFDPNDPYRFIPLRRTTNDDGQAISEWQTTLGELAEFARSLDRSADRLTR